MGTKNNLRLYNTLSREIEDFIPLDDNKVGLYACGPTVYDQPHIGHIRRYVLDDVLVRLLRYLNYTVKHVMNITDVGHLVSDSDTGEDKLEKGARREGKTAWDVAKFYEAEFFRVMDLVGVQRPDVTPRATEHITQQIKLVQTLEKKGFTYTIADGVYFDSTKFSDYGKLARLDVKGLQSGARVEQVPGKKHPTDFALWKLTPPRQKRDMEWDSPWGKGFPGWHIECSAMSMEYLGPTLDIHTGGIDHIPVHHTNEIAQSEAVTGKQFVRFWLHHNHLLVNGEKMSKSLGNFITLDDVTKKGFSPFDLRYLFLTTHYRQESNFTWEALSSAQAARKQLVSQYLVIKGQAGKGERDTLSEEKLTKLDNLRKRFKDVLRLDLNTPQAVAIVWEIVKSNVPASDKFDLLQIADEILGLGLHDVENRLVEVPSEVTQLVQKREQLRNAKKWDEADEVRKEIETKGWVVEDTDAGSSLKKK
ncbi:cysteine--tRNA ligase [Candidatus Microgenomates bacterium]|nr:MAG: cysteine--tRNA ligase [Candidatus Microgenomates bacterium]